MKRSITLAGAAAAALALAGCGHLHGQHGHHGGHGGYGSPSSDPVVVIDPRTQTPVVSPDPLFFRKGQTDVLIVWRLPANSGLRFPDNGIVVEGELTTNEPKPPSAQDARGAPPGASAERAVLVRQQTEIVDCKPRAAGAEFTCLNRHTRPGYYKYTVRVLAGSRVLESDPHIMND